MLGGQVLNTFGARCPGCAVPWWSAQIRQDQATVFTDAIGSMVITSVVGETDRRRHAGQTTSAPVAPSRAPRDPTSAGHRPSEASASNRVRSSRSVIVGARSASAMICRYLQRSRSISAAALARSTRYALRKCGLTTDTA